METLVIFTANNARILKVDEAMANEYADFANVCVNPDLSAVKGIPPHLWKMENGHVVPMNKYESAYREKKLQESEAAGSVMIRHDEKPMMPGKLSLFIMLVKSIFSKLLKRMSGAA